VRVAILILGVDPVVVILSFAAWVGVYLPISITLNLELGYTGIPNFGKALFVALGALVAGGLMARITFYLLGVQGNFLTDTTPMTAQVNSILSNNAILSMGLLFMTLAMAAGIGALMGYVASYPAIRLREDYLAMTLLVMAEFFILFANNYTPLVTGTIGIPLPNVFAWAGTSSINVATLFLVVFAVLCYFYSERVVRSPLGRTLRAIRDNENASEALGKDTVSFRRNILIVASALTAMTGVFFAFYQGYVQPAQYPRLDWTIIPWVMVIMGGAANNFGVAMGVIIYEGIIQTIQYLKFPLQPYVPFDVNYLQYIVVGILVASILIYRPEGIFKEKSSATLGKSKTEELMKPFLPTPFAEAKGPPPPADKDDKG
jgi:branched-chain amino acid transport system permease protein